MQQKYKFIITVLSAILFTILFYKNAPGLNLLIFEFAIIGCLFFTKQLNLKSLNSKIIFTSQILTCLFTVLTHSTFVYIIHFSISFVFAGMLIYPFAKSSITSLQLSAWNIFASQKAFGKEISESNVMNHQPAKMMKEARLFFIPILIISLFMMLYNKSNPKFNELTINARTGLFDFLDMFFTKYDLTLLLTFIIGIIISNIIFFRKTNSNYVSIDQDSSDMLFYYRSKIITGISKLKMKNELKSAMFLLIILNCILLIVNVIDIKWVWFGFEWEGQYLKQFVHEATGLLIISILISIGLVLYYFRGGLNYVNNKSLKYLSYLWLSQNFILAISVCIRNYYYVQHFNLAFKRIGVFIFIILTIYGLYSVIKKVHGKYSSFYLLRTNFMAMIIVLTCTSLVNWDNVIAKFNFRHSDTAFIHYNFLSGLSDATLPVLDKTESELAEIDKVQSSKFSKEKYYINSNEYHQIIKWRKKNFKTEWESKNLLSWNLPEQIAYNNLKSN